MTIVLNSVVGGRYKKLIELGVGGVGKTFLAEDLHRLGSPCAVKQLIFTSNNAEELSKVKELFKREAETLLRLGEHVQIPYLFAYFQENQKFYLVQELIDGHQLSEELSTGKRFDEQELIEFLEQVLEILKFVHSQGVIHRDIKPENIMRRKRDGKLVLIDFGGVKAIAALSSNTQIQGRPTQIYTPGYAPREQISGSPEFNSDIYALGMVTIQTLTGLEPTAISRDNCTGEIKWREQAPQVSVQLAAVIDKMVRDDFERRYQSVGDVLDDLRELKKTLVVVPQQIKPRGTTRLPNIPIKTSLVLLPLAVLVPILAVTAFAAGFLTFLPKENPKRSVSPPPPPQETSPTPEPEATLSSPINPQPPASTPNPTSSSEKPISPEPKISPPSPIDNQQPVPATSGSTPPDSEEGGIFLRPESLPDSQ